MERDYDLTLPVYLCLVGLTLATAASAYWGGLGRIVAITLALSIAGMKAGLIGLYYMHLKDEGGLIYGIVAVGLLMLLILAFGILPDVGLRL